MNSKHPLIAKYVNEDWSVNWPADLTERREPARLVLGAWLVGKQDTWIKTAQDLMEHPKPRHPYPRNHKASEKDKAYRDVLSTLLSEQKQTCLRLVREVANKVLFSMLVTFDQIKYGRVALQIVLDFDDTGRQEVIEITQTDNDLHEDLFHWVELFSGFADEYKQDLEAVFDLPAS